MKKVLSTPTHNEVTNVIHVESLGHKSTSAYKKTLHGSNQHDKVLGDNENESTLKEIPHTWSDHDGGNIVRHGFNNNINGGWSRVSHNLQIKIPQFNFNGEIKLHEWISKIRRSFQHSKAPHDKTKVCMALRHMEGV